MRRIEQALLIIAVVTLGSVASIYVYSRVDQWRQGRELDELRARTAAVRGNERRDASAPASHREPPSQRAVIGRIEAPRVGLSAIVREGIDASTLRRAVGHVPKTALPGEIGNVALAAHRDTFFRPLRRVRSGDRIRFTTPEAVHEYRVSRTRIVDPEETSVLDATAGKTLTLITCYPFSYIGSAPQRFVVTANPIEPSGDRAIGRSGDRVTRRSDQRAARLSDQRIAKVSKPRGKPTQVAAAKRPAPVVKRASAHQPKLGFWGKLVRVLGGTPSKRAGRTG